MNTRQKCTINSTNITVALIYPHWSIMQISSHLDMYSNLYEKDKLLLQEFMSEQDELITHSYSTQNS
jgi:hypothetical protein